MKNQTHLTIFLLSFCLLLCVEQLGAQSSSDDQNGTNEKQVSSENGAVEQENTSTDGDTKELPDTVITTTRFEEPVSDATRSVTYLDRQQIEKQSIVSRDLGDILGKTVPGLGTSTEALTNFTQTLRGRKFLVLIDGVPISTPLRDGARDAKVISSEALETIEVIRGGTAVYGFGATGGIVHYRTREAGDEEHKGFSELRLEGSTEEPDDSLHTSTAHGAYGDFGNTDYVLNLTAAERNSFYDAEGDRIPPEPLSNQGGLADTTEWNGMIKTGYDFDNDHQRIELMVNNYDIEQDTEYVTQNGDISEDEKAIGVSGEPQGENMKTEKTLARAIYTNDQVLDSRLKLNTYYLDRTARFGFSPSFQSQSESETQRVGTRLTMNTPLSGKDGAELIWGIDAMNEETEQNPIAGSNPFGVDPVPLMDVDALAGFTELNLPVSDVGKLRTGLRHEEFSMSVDDYSNFENTNTVEGGELDFSETLFNATGVVYLTDRVDVFGGFSQGFAPAEVGRVLREQADSGDSVEEIDPEAQTVDNYELGVRGTGNSVSGSVVGFFSESDLGTGFDSNLDVIRNEEEIWGIETSFEVDLHEQWNTGGTTTWMWSATDEDDDGDLDEELPNTRVPPPKFTGFVEYNPSEQWTTRVQALYSGTRRPDSTAFGSSPVTSFFVVDLHTSVKVGPGSLRFGIENLLNEDYFPVANQAFGRDDTFSKGSGRTVALSYQLKW